MNKFSRDKLAPCAIDGRKIGKAMTVSRNGLIKDTFKFSELCMFYFCYIMHTTHIIRTF